MSQHPGLGPVPPHSSSHSEYLLAPHLPLSLALGPAAPSARKPLPSPDTDPSELSWKLLPPASPQPPPVLVALGVTILLTPPFPTAGLLPIPMPGTQHLKRYVPNQGLRRGAQERGQLLPGSRGPELRPTAKGPSGWIGVGALNPDLNPLPNSGRTRLLVLLFTDTVAVDPTPAPHLSEGCCENKRRKFTLNTQHWASQGAPVVKMAADRLLQGTQVRSWSRKIPRALKQPSPCAAARELGLKRKQSATSTTATEAREPRACAPQGDRPLQPEACTP